MNSPRATRPFPPHAQKERASERETASTLDKSRGRVERRTLTTTTALNQHLNWPGLKQVGRIVRQRTHKGKTSVETTYYITSLGRCRASVDRLLGMIRGHWGAIENGLHWVRDEVLGEDRCPIQAGHAPQNLAALRNALLNLLRRGKVDNLTAKLREFARNSQRLFTELGHVK